MDIVSFAIGMSAAGDKTELLENVEIPVDFSNGNQTVEAEEGKAIKSAVIQKPETLVAENIAKDVNIAGIIGTLESGGGEGDFTADRYFEGGYAEVNLPNAEKLKDYAFYQDTALTNITIPKVKSIGGYTFAYCGNLALTSLPNELTSLGNYAFRECKNLVLTSLPSGIKSIGSYTFYNCTKLALTSLPNELTSIGEFAFANCTNLALTSLPSGLTRLNQGVFYKCTNLALTSLPSGITYIDASTFYNCTKLALTSLPNELGSIESSAFEGCTNLALTSLPDGVNRIASSAFKNCTGLTTITFKQKPGDLFSNTAFTGCTNLTTINVPWAEGAVSGAPWGATNATINYNYTEE